MMKFLTLPAAFSWPAAAEGFPGSPRPTASNILAQGNAPGNMASISPRSPTGSRILAQGNALGNIASISPRSPTGSRILAQGSALGHVPQMFRRLKACRITRLMPDAMKQTFSLPMNFRLKPRALPWASMPEAVGLQEVGAPLLP